MQRIVYCIELPNSDAAYTEAHEWVRKDSDGTFTVGITEYAQEQLGDVCFIELPSEEQEFQKGTALFLSSFVSCYGIKSISHVSITRSPSVRSARPSPARNGRRAIHPVQETVLSRSKV